MKAPPPRILSSAARVVRLDALPPGVERYPLAGGEMLAVRLAPGDALTVIDEEGGQPAEVAAYRADGKCAPAILRADGAAHKAGAAAGMKKILAKKSAAPLLDELRRFGFAAAEMRAIKLFGADSRPGERAEFVAAESAAVMVAAPGEDMAAFAQNPPTPLLVFVKRAAFAAADERPPPRLPAPLAEPLADLRISRATARAYPVKKGEWIQIIDVEGRQCTDFQAFRAAALDRGIERCLDVTATRAVNGGDYPRPGLAAKFCDYDFEPLVEIVRDKCPRHDAFGLACSAKYYDDLGYPGHANCSDNFNAALAPFGVAARRGWMSMNFFYNTGFCEAGSFYLREPLSVAGDYVLLRALTDLVCVSSACPDDIDAANGWNPTDIHIRTYPAKMTAARAVGFRKRPDREAEMTKETGFHSKAAARTRHFIDYNGYWLPARYNGEGAISEYRACRERAAVMDLSPLRKFEVLGPDAEALLQYCLTRDVRRLAIGQVVYSAMCYDNGGMIDDGTLFRLGDANFRWVGGCDYGGEWLRRQAADLNLDARVKSSTDQLHNIAVQGPASRDVLAEMIWTPPKQPALAELKWFRFAVARLGGASGAPLVVSRTGYTGELGFEIFCHPKDASALWDAVMQAGEKHGVAPLGLDALDMLRIESGLIFAGYEFDDQTDPFEAGIGFAVALKTKTEDFIARDALIRRRDNPQRRLTGLEIAADEPVGHGDIVYAGRQKIGVVTSAVRSPVLAKNIALARVSAESAAAGLALAVGKPDGGVTRLPAVTVPFPFYDPEKKRVRA